MKNFILGFLIFSLSKFDTIHTEQQLIPSLQPSVAMNKTLIKAVVSFYRTSYAKSKTNYPVLYLFHGAYGHFNDWLSKTIPIKIVHQLWTNTIRIIVMPGGRDLSFT
jgi:hypothetical protein